VEDPKRALFIHGGKTSQTIKDVLTDLYKLKGVEGIKYTKKNADITPFEAGGELSLEQHSQSMNCSLFAIGSHTKKRPNNLIMGRMYDFHLYDMVEFGVSNFKSISSCPGAVQSQLGNKPCFVFVGDGFENNAELRQTKSLLLDFFRGRQVDAVNLQGLDRVVFVTHKPAQKEDTNITARTTTSTTTAHVVLFRQYSVGFKKSGTKVPRVALTEAGPSLDLVIRRTKQPPNGLEKEALKQPKLEQKKQKNVGGDILDGKIGRIYMPKQDVDEIALGKMKGVKRERREKAASGKKKQKKEGDSDSD
jgi:ribosome production factor 2